MEEGTTNFRNLFLREPDSSNYREALFGICERIASGEIGNAEGYQLEGEARNNAGLPPVDPNGGVERPGTHAHLDALFAGFKKIKHWEAALAKETAADRAAFPAWQLLVRGPTSLDAKRNWGERWKAAGEEVKWAGASRFGFAALKTSPIWKVLGRGTWENRDDSLGNPFPPFAFDSSMDWKPLTEEEAKMFYLSVPRFSPPPNYERLFGWEPNDPEYCATLLDICKRVADQKLYDSDGRLEAYDALERAGFKPVIGGDLFDFRSDEHLKAVIDGFVYITSEKTNRSQECYATIDQFPAWKMILPTSVPETRDWGSRWLAAARSVEWSGVARSKEMIALKISPIWQALGEGAGGFENDSLGNPFPPFSLGSGVLLEIVDRDQCKKVGLNVDALIPADILNPINVEKREAFKRCLRATGFAHVAEEVDQRSATYHQDCADIQRALEKLGPDYKRKLEEWAHFGEDDPEDNPPATTGRKIFRIKKRP